MTNEAPFSVVVVTGLSGAGRSTALSAIEDLGFYCVDNLPPSAFAPCLEACQKDRLRRVALGIDVRVRAFLDPTLDAIARLEEDQAQDFTLLFLDASDSTLLARYSATRRPHPLRIAPHEANQSLAVIDGIQIERERLAPLRANASSIVDTSELTVHELRRRIVEMFRPKSEGTSGMLTRFVSFGFKYGAPSDVDTMFDVRFIDNPYFIPELRPHSGLDAAVREFVRGATSADQFAQHAEGLLTFLIPEYQREGKSYFTVGFGCTGGRHRSVAMAEWVAERMQAQGFQIEVGHRDVARVEREKERQRRAELADDV